MVSSVVLAVAAVTMVSCNRRASTSASATALETHDVSLDDWVGVYASPGEIAGFSRTVLVLEKDHRGRLSYRMTRRSDVLSVGSIKPDELSGDCIASGSELYVPQGYGYYDDEKQPQLLASIDRYTMLTINDRRVLMRDDALAAYRRDNKLYDYGILIRTGEKPASVLDLDTVAAPSVKLLYQDAAKPWRDPFVHGPNER